MLWIGNALMVAGYVGLGVFFRRRELRFRPNAPLGIEAVLTTVLFWPWKVSVVFLKKARRKWGAN